MALPEKDLSVGQASVLGPLLINYRNATERLRSAQEEVNTTIAILEEYSRQVADKLGVDIVKDYSFDIATQKFVDRTTLPVQAAETAQPVVTP